MVQIHTEHWAGDRPSEYQVDVGAVTYVFTSDPERPHEYEYQGEGDAPDHVVDALDEYLEA